MLGGFMAAGPAHLYHYVCLRCEWSFKRSDEPHQLLRRCGRCGQDAIFVGRHFKAPKKGDRAQWEKVRFLISKGFLFQHVRDPETGQYVRYPNTLGEAKEFVEVYRAQVWEDALAQVRRVLGTT